MNKENKNIDVINEEEGFEPNILTLQDEEGTEHLFELIDTQDIENETYTALVPYFENDADMLESDSELLILKVVKDEEGEFLNIIEDEEEFNKVSSIFMDNLSDLYDIKD
ncbi:MAG: DUF1292 domain-containing protein [Oscillospiraceae bacterium]